MQITSVQVLLLESATSMRPVGCRIHTDSGLYGDGEATMAYGGAAKGVASEIAEMAKYILGQDPLSHEVIWSRMRRESYWGLNGGSVIYSAMSAIDIALWDLKGKFFGVPVHALLGGKRRTHVRGYASQIQNGWGPAVRKTGRFFCDSPSQLAQAAQAALDEGFDAVKLDVAIDGCADDRLGMGSRAWLNTIARRVAGVREQVGPDVDIILENHAHTSVATGIAIGRAVKEFGIFYYEEPCEPDPVSFQAVAKGTDLPLATGERLYGTREFLPFFAQYTLHVAQPDVGNCGGITEAKKICDLADTFGVGIQMHNCHTQISNAATLHIEACIANFVIHEHAGHNLWRPATFDEYCTVRFDPVGGRIEIPDSPGLGVEWVERTLETAQIETVSL